MAEHDWGRVEADDPNRCQAVTNQGQCRNRGVEGSSYCIAHGGRHAAAQAAAEGKRIYRLGKWRNRVSEHADHDQVKSLREEIGVLRILIEERMSTCQNAAELNMYAGPLADLVMKVEKLVTSCNKIETHLGSMLDKAQALQLGQEMVEIIGKHLQECPSHDDLVGKISVEIEDPELLAIVVACLDDCKSREDILEGVSNDIVAAVERLGKAG